VPRFLEEPALRFLIILHHGSFGLTSAHELIDIVAEKFLDVGQVLIVFFLFGLFFFWAVSSPLTFIFLSFRVIWVFDLVLIIVLVVPFLFFILQ